MGKIKDKVMDIIKVFSLKELRILPAYLSYNLVLAVIPIFTILLLIASLFSISIENIISFIRSFIPDNIGNFIISVISGKDFDVTLGVLNFATLGVATNGTYAIINASNNLYGVENSGNSFIRDRLKAILMLFLLISLFLFLIIVPILGERIITFLGNYRIILGVLEDFILIYRVVRWPFTFLIIFITVKTIYVIAPSIKVKSENTTLGAFLATIGFLLFTSIFSYYIKYFGKYDLVYGSLSSIIIVFIWIYALSYILLFGIVINTSKYNKSEQGS